MCRETHRETFSGITLEDADMVDIFRSECCLNAINRSDQSANRFIGRPLICTHEMNYLNVCVSNIATEGLKCVLQTGDQVEDTQRTPAQIDLSTTWRARQVHYNNNKQHRVLSWAANIYTLWIHWCLRMLNQLMISVLKHFWALDWIHLWNATPKFDSCFRPGFL